MRRARSGLRRHRRSIAPSVGRESAGGMRIQSEILTSVTKYPCMTSSAVRFGPSPRRPVLTLACSRHVERQASGPNLASSAERSASMFVNSVRRADGRTWSRAVYGSSVISITDPAAPARSIASNWSRLAALLASCTRFIDATKAPTGLHHLLRPLRQALPSTINW